MKTSLTTVTGVLIAAVLGAGAGFASWQFFKHEDGPTPLFVELTPAKAPPPPPELMGAAAPDFALPDLAGEQRTLADWSGKVVVLNFWATWCAPCREEMPMLVEIGDEYRGKGVEVVGVAVDDRDKIAEFVDEFRVNFPIVYGELAALKLSQTYGNRIGALPYTAIIDRQGRIVHMHAGILKKPDLERELMTLL